MNPFSTKPPCASPQCPHVRPRLWLSWLGYLASSPVQPATGNPWPPTKMGYRRLPSGLSRMTGNCHVRI